VDEGLFVRKKKWHDLDMEVVPRREYGAKRQVIEVSEVDLMTRLDIAGESGLR
jgi:hypothetical protein